MHILRTKLEISLNHQFPYWTVDTPENIASIMQKETIYADRKLPTAYSVVELFKKKKKKKKKKKTMKKKKKKKKKQIKTRKKKQEKKNTTTTTNVATLKG